MNFKICFILGTLTLTLTGCGGSGHGSPAGKVCSANSNPVPFDLNPDGANNKPLKVSLEQITSVLGTGDYTYEGAHLFYSNSSQKIQMSVLDQRNDKSKAFELKIDCVSGIQPKTQQVDLSSEQISAFSIYDGEISKVQTRKFEILFNEGVFLNKKVSEVTSTDSLDLKKIYESQKIEAVAYVVGSDSTTSYEIRTRRTLSKGEQVETLIKFKKTLPAATLNEIETRKSFNGRWE